jgi:hypothetical protein
MQNRVLKIKAYREKKSMKTLQKIGGIAALGHAASLVVGMVLSFTLMVAPPGRRARSGREVSGRPPEPHVPLELDC